VLNLLPYIGFPNGGALVLKVIMGKDSEHFRNEVRQFFPRVQWMKPDASRKESRETYLQALYYSNKNRPFKEDIERRISEGRTY
jgi:23S rRNA U2552 (ribose-2'-O)-methylase RlmE/FtsJ